MPIIVGSTPTITVTSSDGVVTADVLSTWASVGVTIDWQSASPMPWRTTVIRTNPDGSTAIVRSGDLMYTPGGDGYAYDHEAPLEGTISYQAFGYSAAGVLVQTSLTATVTLPAASKTAWLKSVSNPSLSRQIKLRTTLDESWDQPTVIFDVPGRRNPVIWEDVQKGLSGSVSTRTKSKAEFDAIRALVGSGTLLLQASVVDNAIPYDVFLKPIGGLKVARPGDMPGFQLRWPSFAFREVDRPATTDSPLRIPNWTNAIVAATYASYAAFDAAFPSYLAQAKGP